MKNTKTRLFLVDNNSIDLKALRTKFLANPDFDVTIFTTGELCIKSLKFLPEIIILDYYLSSTGEGIMNGVQTLDKIKLLHPEIVVIFLSVHDKIEVAKNTAFHGAFDYVLKSETTFSRLLKMISIILLIQKLQKELKWYMDRM